MGAGGPAPSFSLTPRDIALLQMRDLDEVQAELDREMAQVRLDALRRECECANELERQLAALYEEHKILKGIASMLLIGYPVLWLVTR